MVFFFATSLQKSANIELSHLQADTEEEAEAAYYALWENGMVEAVDYEMGSFDIREVLEEALASTETVMEAQATTSALGRDGHMPATDGREAREGGEHRKPYLAKFSIRDGEHEHHGEFLVQAASYEEAFALAKSQEHEPELPEDEDELTCWDYGDGTTSSRLDGVIELTEEEARILRRLGLAFNFN